MSFVQSQVRWARLAAIAQALPGGRATWEGKGCLLPTPCQPATPNPPASPARPKLASALLT